MQRDAFFMATDRHDHDITLAAPDPVGQALRSVRQSIRAGRLRADPRFWLSRESFASLRARYFADEGPEHGDEVASSAPPMAAEFLDLVRLLIEHRAHDGIEIEWLAHAIACGCMGKDHLYQDMGLPNRQALSDLLREHFTALFLKNTGNMKWKKFLYKQLCDRAEIQACSAPSCQACSDYWNCFGPEEPVSWDWSQIRE